MIALLTKDFDPCLYMLSCGLTEGKRNARRACRLRPGMAMMAIAR